MHEAVAALAGAQVSPIVRVAANEGWMVKRALSFMTLEIRVTLILIRGIGLWG